MDINKADYGTIIKFGNLESFSKKIKMEKQDISEIINILDDKGISLLEKALISRKFEIGNFLLDNNANVNVVSNEGCNELHYLAANINFDGAVKIAYRLLDKGVSLNLKERKLNNSALWCLCQEIFKKRTEEGISLIEECLKRQPDIKSVNSSGFSVEWLINERGTDILKKTMEDVIDE